MSAIKDIFRDRHFLAATIILALAAGTWRVAVAKLKISLHHEPVPWAIPVTVSNSGDDSFRNTSFPKTLGPYRFIDEDKINNETGDPRPDGISDGETIMKSDSLEILGMGTSFDRSNIPNRTSNWYLSRVYEDTREPAGSQNKLWLLRITYYTGGLDTVPHIAETCWQAGGMRIASSGGMKCDSPQDAPEAWKGTLTWQRVLGESNDMRQFAGYYIFSLNGRPEDSRERVRLGLMDLWVKHSYFAKIEVVPRGATSNAEETDRKAREFIQASLGEVLKTLPMPSDIKKLESESP